MTERQKESIVRRLQAMTDGPTPLLHSIHQTGNMLSVHIQPWGSPIYLSWSQAEVFTKGLPLEIPAQRKAAASEHGRQRIRYAK